MSDRNKGILLALTGALLYSTIPIFGKIAVTIFSPIFVTFVVPALVALLLFVIVIIKKEIIKNVPKKDALWIVAIGFFAALGSLFSFQGLSLGKASDAGFLLQFELLFSGILAYIFLKEKLSFRQIVGILLMMLGAYVFTFKTTFLLNIANILFLLAAFVWGINTVIVRRQLKNFSPLYIAFGRYFVSSLILFSFATSSFSENIKKITAENAFLFLLYAVVVSGLILLLYHSLRYIKAAEASSFQLLAPILTAIISVFFLGEHIEAVRLMGGGVVILGLFLMIKRKAN